MLFSVHTDSCVRTYILGCCMCYNVMPEIVQFMIGLLKCFCFGPKAGATLVDIRFS